MYLYSFNTYAGFDRVFKAESSVKLAEGDLVDFGNSVFLVLGNNIMFEELYQKHKLEISIKPEILYKKFFSEKTLLLINHLVYTYYTSYHNIISLFVDDDISRILLAQSAVKKGDNKQSLIVFPDLWAAANFNKKILELDINEANILHSQSTPKQKINEFWGLKTGKQSNLICTYSQIFKEYQFLENIVIVDIHKWYYKSQQDPRYAAVSVLEKMAEIYDSNIEEIGYKI